MPHSNKGSVSQEEHCVIVLAQVLFVDTISPPDKSGRAGGMGYGVWGMGYGVWGMGYGVWGMGYKIFSVCPVPVKAIRRKENERKRKMK